MTEETQQQSIGLRLQESRRQKDLTQEAVAEQLNLNIRSIEALEADDFGSISPPMFTRGYLRAYSKLLGIDADQLIDDYNKLAPPEPELSSAYQPLKETKSSHPIVRWATLAIVLVIGTLLVFWWYGPRYQSTEEAFVAPDSGGQEPTTVVVADAQPAEVDTRSEETIVDVEPAQMIVAVNSDESAANAVEVAVVVVEQTQTPDVGSATAESSPIQPVVIANPTFVDSSVITAQEVSTQSTSQETLAQADQSDTAIEGLAAIGSAMAATSPVAADLNGSWASTVPQVSDEPADSETAAVNTIAGFNRQDAEEPPVVGSDIMGIQTTSESWVEVIDANGARLMYGMLGEGRSRSLKGTAPFQVFLGNTPGITITMNGGAVNQPQYNAITNTSRFSVNADGSMQR